MAKEAAAGIVTAPKPPAGKGLEGALQELISNVPAIKRVLVQARERGFVTHDEINAALPEDEISPEVVDELIAMFEEMGVSVGGGEANGAAAKGDLERDEDEDGAAAFDEDLGRTDDPVRMYLREMGTIELLSREGEIEIAKRIEAGRNTVLEALCESPLDHARDHQLARRDRPGQGAAARRDRSRGDLWRRAAAAERGVGARRQGRQSGFGRRECGVRQGRCRRLGRGSERGKERRRRRVGPESATNRAPRRTPNRTRTSSTRPRCRCRRWKPRCATACWRPSMRSRRPTSACAGCRSAALPPCSRTSRATPSSTPPTSRRAARWWSWSTRCSSIPTGSTAWSSSCTRSIAA